MFNNFKKKRLGDLLLEGGRISAEELKEALVKQKTTGKKLGELLIENGVISENEILDLLEIQLGIPRVNIEMINVDMKAIMSIPQSIAMKHNLIPLEFRGKKILIAMSDPLNFFAVDDAKIASSFEVEVAIAAKEEIKKAIDKYYSNQYVKKVAEALTKEKQVAKQEQDTAKTSLDDVKNAPAVQLVDSVIKNAIELRASDIHIESFEKYVKIRYRVDGQLEEIMRFGKETAPALITRIKILGNMDIAEKRIPQDGRILTVVDEKEVDLRVSILPTVHGEKVVIRILKRESTISGTAHLGMTYEELEKLESIIKNPHGIILVTGPTGSGKSTTLYTVLSQLNSNDKNIITVEDPVEYMLEGISQVNVNVKAGLDFASGLRSILRQDPDIIMIGEIRDNETAAIATKAAITGHLVLSTLHTNDAPSSILRLVDMGIEPYLVATSVVGIIAQRLVRKICPSCKVDYEANHGEKRVLGMMDEKSVKLHKGKGCTLCNNSGYMGRTGVYEIMPINREIRELIMNNGNSETIRDAGLRQGMKTIRIACTRLVMEGTTTIEELVKIAHLKE